MTNARNAVPGQDLAPMLLQTEASAQRSVDQPYILVLQVLTLAGLSLVSERSVLAGPSQRMRRRTARCEAPCPNTEEKSLVGLNQPAPARKAQPHSPVV